MSCSSRDPTPRDSLNRLFTRDIAKLKVNRCGYGLACYEDGGLLVDGIVMRLGRDLFWYLQADGDFCGWARAHAIGLDVEISDPGVFVSQVQGPRSLEFLDAASKDGLPDGFTCYGIARVDLGGQEFVISRTGFTNELGWEFYTEPHHDADALWDHLRAHGVPFGMDWYAVDSTNPRRVEAGILNAGSDFNRFTTPYDVGLGRFVDEHKSDFIGKAALRDAPRERRQHGITCRTGDMTASGAVEQDGVRIGVVTAAAMSPCLGLRVGYVLFDRAGLGPGHTVRVRCRDGSLQDAELVELPMYDRERLIPRGKLVDIPRRA